MKKIIALSVGLLCADIGLAQSETLMLEQALELARQTSPELQAARLNVEAAQQGLGAAGLWKDPKLEFEAEGLGWDNDLYSDGEYTLGLIQEFQLGGKQKKARRAAQKTVEIAGHSEAEKKVGLIDEVRRAFLEVLSLQESGKVQAEQEELARAFVEVAQRRLETGGGSELEMVQAELEFEKVLFSQTCCLGELLAAREKLAYLIALPEKEMGVLDGPYFELENVTAFVVDDSYPTLMRLNAEADRFRAAAQRARAKDVSNIKLGAGYKYEGESEINTFVLMASMPLGIHKQGRAEQASILRRVDATEAERDEVRRRLQSALAEAQAMYMGARAQVEMGKNKLIPKAEQAYELSLAGYESGRFSWLELIAAQQHLADIRIGYIEALKEAHLARIEILKLKTEGI
jgi:cobalt-zinc-cadmium efflux system outer membrane protein